MFRFRTSLFLPALALIPHSLVLAQAEIVYSNLQNFGNTTSLTLDVHTVWDDIDLTHGGKLSGLQFIVRNNPGEQFGGTIEFRKLDNPEGGPLGTRLGQFSFSGVSGFDSLNFIRIWARSLEHFNIILPDEPFAVGISPETGGWLFPFYGPPTIGSSTNARWISEGDVVYDIPQTGSYGWEFTVVPIPEPHSSGLVLTATCLAGLGRLKRGRE